MGEYFQIPDETISLKTALKAKGKVITLLEKRKNKSMKKPDDPKSYDQMYMANTNASLWIKYIQGDHFSRLLKRLLTSTQISRDHVHKVRNTYHKWMINPTTSNLNKYSHVLLQTGRSYEVMCELNVIDKFTDGSSVHYQPINDVRLRKLDLSGVKSVPVGNYYIWREKNGETYSEPSSANFCITKQQHISISALLE